MGVHRPGKGRWYPRCAATASRALSRLRGQTGSNRARGWGFRAPAMRAIALSSEGRTKALVQKADENTLRVAVGQGHLTPTWKLSLDNSARTKREGNSRLGQLGSYKRVGQLPMGGQLPGVEGGTNTVERISLCELCDIKLCEGSMKAFCGQSVITCGCM